MVIRKILICMLTMLILTSCNEPAYKNNDETKKDEAIIQTEEDVVDFNNLKEEEYLISDIPGKVTVGEKFNVYSQDNEYTEEMCSSNSVTSEQIQQLLNMKTFTGINMYIFPADKPMSNTDFEINIKVKEKEYEDIGNLKDVNDVDFDLIAQALVMGFSQDSGTDVPSYEAYENNSTKWIVFNIKSVGYETRYATIINGKMIYVIGKNANENVTAEQHNDIEEIIDSLKYVAD